MDEKLDFLKDSQAVPPPLEEVFAAAQKINDSSSNRKNSPEENCQKSSEQGISKEEEKYNKFTEFFQDLDALARNEERNSKLFQCLSSNETSPFDSDEYESSDSKQSSQSVSSKEDDNDRSSYDDDEDENEDHGNTEKDYHETEHHKLVNSMWITSSNDTTNSMASSDARKNERMNCKKTDKDTTQLNDRIERNVTINQKEPFSNQGDALRVGSHARPKSPLLYIEDNHRVPQRASGARNICITSNQELSDKTAGGIPSVYLSNTMRQKEVCEPLMQSGPIEIQPAATKSTEKCVQAPIATVIKLPKNNKVTTTYSVCNEEIDMTLPEFPIDSSRRPQRYFYPSNIHEVHDHPFNVMTSYPPIQAALYAPYVEQVYAAPMIISSTIPDMMELPNDTVDPSTGTSLTSSFNDGLNSSLFNRFKPKPHSKKNKTCCNFAL